MYIHNLYQGSLQKEEEEEKQTVKISNFFNTQPNIGPTNLSV